MMRLNGAKSKFNHAYLDSLVDSALSPCGDGGEVGRRCAKDLGDRGAACNRAAEIGGGDDSAACGVGEHGGGGNAGVDWLLSANGGADGGGRRADGEARRSFSAASRTLRASVVDAADVLDRDCMAAV